jgi:hypothetical protein
MFQAVPPPIIRSSKLYIQYLVIVKSIVEKLELSGIIWLHHITLISRYHYSPKRYIRNNDDIRQHILLASKSYEAASCYTDRAAVLIVWHTGVTNAAAKPADNMDSGSDDLMLLPAAHAASHLSRGSKGRSCIYRPAVHHKLQTKWQFARVQADGTLETCNMPLLAPYRYCTSSLAIQVAKWRRRKHS